MENASPAWMFWLNHWDVVEKAASRRAQTSGLDEEDVKHDLIILLVKKHDKYDASRSSPSTWAWWNARQVTKAAISRKIDLMTSADSELINLQSDCCSSQRKMDAAIGVNWAFERASEKEWDSVCARVNGLSTKEIKDTLACVRFSVNRRINRLAVRLQQGG